MNLVLFHRESGSKRSWPLKDVSHIDCDDAGLLLGEERCEEFGFSSEDSLIYIHFMRGVRSRPFFVKGAEWVINFE